MYRSILALLAVFLAPAALAQTPVAFVNANVISMDGEQVLRRQTVIVLGDRVTRVGPAAVVDVPDNARVIDAEGRYLLPGLAEMHGHIPPPTQPRQDVENTLFLYLANGITTVRGMLGWPGQLALREEANTGAIDAPNLYLAGPSFNGNTVSSPEHAAQRVRDQVAEGWDLLKIHPGLTLAQYDAVARTARALGIRFGGHVPADVGLMSALAAGQETFDHMDGYVEYLSSLNHGEIGGDDLAAVVDRTIEAGAWIVPTMVLWETLYNYPPLDSLLAFPELKYVSPQQVESWTNAFRQRQGNPQLSPELSAGIIAARMRVLEALSDAGARILMGTDAPQQFSVPGFSLHREIRRMQEAGMTPYEVLYSGTVAVGEYFSNVDRFGMVAEGHRADLMLVERNPLEDLSALSERAGVMVRGRWYSESEIQQRLAAIESYVAQE